MSDRENSAKGQTGSVAPAPEKRSFAPTQDADRDDGYQADTFSRNDAEGATAMGGEAEAAADVDARAAKSPDDRFETDPFSRNDAEGGTALGQDEDRSTRTGTSSVEAKPDAAGVRYNEDDPESRNAQTGPA